mmetsp:Transcript_109724/g.319013  ORF Transcript_109724/g.319013 Transcript_109724/m.319013 type:complete len:204 (-) Transcript_109724:188-799(-)
MAEVRACRRSGRPGRAARSRSPRARRTTAPTRRSCIRRSSRLGSGWTRRATPRQRRRRTRSGRRLDGRSGSARNGPAARSSVRPASRIWERGKRSCTRRSSRRGSASTRLASKLANLRRVMAAVAEKVEKVDVDVGVEAAGAKACRRLGRPGCGARSRDRRARRTTALTRRSCIRRSSRLGSGWTRRATPRAPSRRRRRRLSR